MTQINVSTARQTLPQLLNRVFNGEEFVIVKNKIPIAHLIPVKKEKIVKKRILPGATKLMAHLKGDSVDIVNRWRREQETRSYGR